MRAITGTTWITKAVTSGSSTVSCSSSPWSTTTVVNFTTNAPHSYTTRLLPLPSRCRVICRGIGRPRTRSLTTVIFSPNQWCASLGFLRFAWTSTWIWKFGTGAPASPEEDASSREWPGLLCSPANSLSSDTDLRIISCPSGATRLSVEDASPRLASSVSICLLTSEAERRETSPGTSSVLARLDAGGRGGSMSLSCRTVPASAATEDASACG